MIKKEIKIKKIFSLIILVFFFFNLSFLIVENVSAVEFTPQVTIDENITKGKTITIGSDSIGEYILTVYNYAIGSIGILATVIMMYAGILWITAAGNQEQIGKAKAYIASSLAGLVLALCSWMILWTVNPDLTNLKPIEPIKVGEAPDKTRGCCNPYGEDGNAYNTTYDKCTGQFEPGYEAVSGECVKRFCTYFYSCPGNYERSNNPDKDCEGRVKDGNICCCKPFLLPLEGGSSFIGTDKTVRDDLENSRISINKTCTVLANGQTTGTCLNDLPQRAIDGLKTIRDNVDTGTMIWITGGTETMGHQTHGPGKAIVDLRICSSDCKDRNGHLTNYIYEQLGQSASSMINDRLYTSIDGKITVIREKNNDLSEHFHIIFN